MAVLLTRRGPTPARCTAAGVLLAAGAVTRGNGAPELVAMLAVLIVARAGWRSLLAAALAFAGPAQAAAPEPAVAATCVATPAPRP